MRIHRKLRSFKKFIMPATKTIYLFTLICVTVYITTYCYLVTTLSSTNKNQFHRRNHQNIHYYAEQVNKINVPGRSWHGMKIIHLPPPPKRLKIRGITIRGERHSGTGFLRQLITKNCPEMTSEITCEEYRGDLDTSCEKRSPWLQNLDIDEKYGWKHSVLNSEKILDPEDLLIAIFRNYTTWLPKMRKETYERVPKKNIPMHDFLRSNWLPDFKPAGKESDKMLDTQQWQNVFQMRTTKYSKWLEYTTMYPLSSLSVKYEELASNSTKFLKSLLDEYDMPCKPFDEWDPVNCHAKYGRCLGRTVGEKKMVTGGGKYTDEDYNWKSEDWEFALANLDKDLERKIGYL